jgi:hypothetical protein
MLCHVKELRGWDGEALYAGAGAAQKRIGRALAFPHIFGSPPPPDAYGAAQPPIPAFGTFAESVPKEARLGAFQAHLDAAGCGRAYGMHHPYALGSKLTAVLGELERLRAAHAADGAASGKAVVFSDSPDAMDVLHEALRRSWGDGAIARIEGTSSHEQRTVALSKFRDAPACFVLLLSVRACASGLTLNVASHVLLVELQQHEGMELQLINRVWRIGQTKDVVVKRFVSAGTVEERMLALRAKSRGLMATNDADSVAVSAVPAEAGSSTGRPATSKAAKAAASSATADAAAERFEDLHYLLGPAQQPSA